MTFTYRRHRLYVFPFRVVPSLFWEVVCGSRNASPVAFATDKIHVPTLQREYSHLSSIREEYRRKNVWQFRSQRLQVSQTLGTT